MEHKTWLWKRKPSEKTITVSEKADQANEQEEEKALEMERLLRNLNEELVSVRTESSAKDELLAKQAKVAEDAIAGWEKAEAEAASLKQELDDALHQRAAAEERKVNIDAALKECMQQLHIIEEEQQHFISDAAMKISKEQEKTRLLEERLAETNKRLVKLGIENSNLSRILEVKEKLIEDLSECKSHSEANFTAVMARFDSSEKSNASLRYEVCMLQKEHEIRNEEREFNLKAADAARKQYLESIKKITKLESECQRLRVMVRKRLPGPAALAKMKSEVEMLGVSTSEMRRKKSNFSMEGVMVKDFVSENCYDASTKRAGSLIERVCAVEEENKILKETLTKKNSELQSSRIMFARTASKLSQAETQVEELSKGQTCLELARSSPGSCDLPLASISEDGGNEDNISCAESWASALISELEHFKSGKSTPSHRTTEVSDLSLMDDFLEMERLAIVCVDKPFERSHFISGESNTHVAPIETDSSPDLSEARGKQLVPLDSFSGFSETKSDVQSSYVSFAKYPNWLQDILRVIVQKHHNTQRSLDVILEEVRVALGNINNSVQRNPSDALHVGGNISQKPQHTSSDSFDGASSTGIFQNETSNRLLQSNLERSICKLIELIEGINERSVTKCDDQRIFSLNDGSSAPYYKSASLTGYAARLFQWKSSELSFVLRHFIIVCKNLLHGKADLENFAGELTSTLDWIINHCFSLQDVSNIKDTIKKHLDWDEHSDSELEVRISTPQSEVDKIDPHEELKRERSIPLLTTSNGLHVLARMEEIETKLKVENMRLKDEIINMEDRTKELEGRLKSATTQNESLITQIQESKKYISNLQGELVKLKESKGLIEDQIENQKLLNEDLDTQLTVAKVELNEARQKFSSLEVELADKSNCCEELEATCLELQLQLESVASKETRKHDMDQEEKQLRTDWEISAASEKLAECQETILNLGKQLKALASPRDAALFDKVIPTPVADKINRRPILLDQMRMEDDAKFEELTSPQTKDIICSEQQKPPASPSEGFLYGHKILTNNGVNSVKSNIHPSPVKSPGMFYGLNESKNLKAETDVGTLALVPKRHKGGVSLLRKLLSRRKRESSKKLNPTVVS